MLTRLEIDECHAPGLSRYEIATRLLAMNEQKVLATLKDLKPFEVFTEDEPNSVITGYTLEDMAVVLRRLTEAEYRHEQAKAALEVFLQKTEWVQTTVQAVELGMHRADVLTQRLQTAERNLKGMQDEVRRIADGLAALGL